MPHDFKTVPIVVICRDRLAPLRELLDWLKGAGYRRFLLVDNGSTYGPLVDFLATTDAEVVRLGRNVGYLAPWSSEVRARLDPDSPFVVSDCDVVPDQDCPSDVVEHLAGVLLRHADIDTRSALVSASTTYQSTMHSRLRSLRGSPSSGRLR
jgi:hypothetical protein